MPTPWTSLSVFFPVLNEAAALPGVIEDAQEVLRGLGLKQYEIIIVDDGSTDSTGLIADNYARLDPHVRIVRHATNLGYGAALSTGFRECKYEWVGYTDGDGQFSLRDITKFFEPSMRVDAILGYRRKRNDHFGRRFNAWLWGLLVHTIVGLNLRDIDCGFKVIRASRLRSLGKLEARGAVISAELLVKLRDGGCKWEQVEVEHYPRRGGEPSGAKLPVILRAVKELLTLREKARHAPSAS